MIIEYENEVRLGCCAHLSMSDGQFGSMSDRMRRNLFERVYFLDTPTYSYSLGAQGNLWVLFRRPRGSKESGTIIDRWR